MFINLFIIIFAVHSVKISLHNFLQTKLSASSFEIRAAGEAHRSTISFLPKNEIYSLICKAVNNISSTVVIFYYFGVSVEEEKEQAETFYSVIQCRREVQVSYCWGRFNFTGLY